MLCSQLWGRCVLMAAHVLCLTTPFGTDAVFSLVGTLCADGSPLFFNNHLWHWCCVLIGGNAVCWWQLMFFFLKQPLLALMLCSHWWRRCVPMAAHVFLTTPMISQKHPLINIDVMYLLVLMLRAVFVSEYAVSMSRVGCVMRPIVVCVMSLFEFGVMYAFWYWLMLCTFWHSFRMLVDTNAVCWWQPMIERMNSWYWLQPMFKKKNVWRLCCVLIVGDAVCWWQPMFFWNNPFGTDVVFSLFGTLCVDGSPCFFNQPLSALMLCSHWWGRCVLVAAIFLLTTPFGTDAVFSLVGTLCADGSHVFF